mgnify:CR=1 FL=1
MYTLDEKTIKSYCDRYNYKYNIFHNSKEVVIDTFYDIWRISLTENNGNNPLYIVRHFNKAGNKTSKMHFHKQFYAWDLHYIFQNIIRHKTKKPIYNNVFRFKNTLKKLNLA